MENNLTYEEFCDVVGIIKTCAYSAFNESRLEIRRSSRYKKDISEDKVKKYIDVYAASNYTYCDEKTYLNYVERELKKFIPQYLHKSTDYEKRAEILLPVVVYSLIIRNEGNRKTVETRANTVRRAYKKDKEKDMDKDKNIIHWQKQNPYKMFREMYYPTDPINQQSAQIREMIGRAQKSSFSNSTFISQSAIETIRQVHYLEENIHILKAMETMSRAGRLLNDILKVEHSDNCQLDTILKLYCVTFIHDVIEASRMLTDDNTTIVANGQIRFKDYHSLDIVGEYAYDQLGYDLAYSFDFSDCKYSFPITFKEGCDSSTIKKFKNTSVKKGNKFKVYYDFLINNFDFAFPNIIDFYLDKEKLEPYTEALDQLGKYIEIQKKLIDCLPTTKDEEPNLNVVFSSINLIKNRKEIIAKQYFISKYQSEAEAEQALEEQEDVSLNYIAVHPKIYDTLEYQCFEDDSYIDDEFADIERMNESGEANDDHWALLEDELFDLFYELNYQKRDYVYDPKQREYLRNQIREKLEIAQNHDKQNNR